MVATRAVAPDVDGLRSLARTLELYPVRAAI
jgi:hypothetical protein